MRNIINLNENWLFTKEDERVTVDLPHTWNNVDGQDGGNDYYRGSCSYKKELNVEYKEDKEYFLEFLGAANSAKVYINGDLVKEHDGGFSTFRVDITYYVSKGKMEIEVICDNSKNDRVYPQSADFTFYGGLYRDVNLIEVSKNHFELVKDGTKGVKVTPVVKTMIVMLL